MDEKTLQKEVHKICDNLGLLYNHIWDSRYCIGKGFPDLVIVGQFEVIYAELKSDTGSLKPEQKEWMNRLKNAGHRVYLWRPCDLTSGRIERILGAL